MSVESALFSVDRLPTHKLHFIIRPCRYSRHTKEGNPYVNMHKQDFENIQLKQRPFPFLESFLYLLCEI